MGPDVWRMTDLESDTSFDEISERTGRLKLIAVGNGPRGVTSDGTRAWVTNTGVECGECLPKIRHEKINATSGTVPERSITVGLNPWGVSSDVAHVWVANESGQTVSEIPIPTTPDSLCQFGYFSPPGYEPCEPASPGNFRGRTGR